jgi:hypothetical protein
METALLEMPPEDRDDSIVLSSPGRIPWRRRGCQPSFANIRRAGHKLDSINPGSMPEADIDVRYGRSQMEV